ncbi:hypothetical protein QBC37DRAFT_402160 [Rhypophila decipiens]|uniref:Uncharacterized protein n=1 Tax=Rhypophila decipiens TaxID=261697 RepID=A0AAN6Y3F1_9PEZI|nr:hypothetical protein QBC37DRAFT_402160 [Rhypophila decipiens]
MEAKQRNRDNQSDQDSNKPSSTPPPDHSPDDAGKPPARKSYLWGCIPDTKPMTIAQLIIVWGGTAVVLGILFLIMIQTPCEPGMGKAECPGWHADDKQVIGGLFETAATATKGADDTIRTIYSAKVSAHDSPSPDVVPAINEHETQPTALRNHFWPSHDDAEILGARHKPGMVHSVVAVTQGGGGLPNHEIKMRAKPSSTSIDLPGSVFITFTPSAVTTRPNTTATSTEDTLPPPDETSQPPVTPSPTSEISENDPQATTTGGGGDEYESTTTIVAVTTVEASGTGSEPGGTHTTKASVGSILRVESILEAVLVVLVVAFLRCQ